MSDERDQTKTTKTYQYTLIEMAKMKKTKFQTLVRVWSNWISYF